MDELTAHRGSAADYDDFVRLHAELEVEDPVPDRAAWVKELAPHALFLSRRGRNLAYAIAQSWGQEAHLSQVAVDPAARRRGVGRALLLALAGRLAEQGCERIRLNVKVGNDPAIRLYACLGLEVHHRSAVLRLPWSTTERLPRAGFEVGAPDPAQDVELERRFDLIAGQIARWREQGDRLFLVGAGEGLARYVAGLGSMPFRPAGLRMARALLEAMRPWAPPASTHLQVVVEGDDDLASGLRDAGGTLLFQVLHMRGPLPRRDAT